ncbi:hypothetical protein HDV05_006556 [Chytridiales sp. JEL 0842]|nr:hypothetical protein HDV05_006556 [Chytridiales sp. JEL 0842]
MNDLEFDDDLDDPIKASAKTGQNQDLFPMNDDFALNTNAAPTGTSGPRRQATLFEAFKVPSNIIRDHQSAGPTPQKNSIVPNVGQTPKGVTAMSYAKAKQTVMRGDDPNRYQHPYDPEAVKTWVYPKNRPVRDYQVNIVQTALFTNTLVALPTGLGKTFIAAVVMYNYFRWFPEGKMVFMAPTKPLVAQQIEACYNITGIPQECTDELTGTSSPELRRLSWLNKRVFFLTPQVLQNDINRGTCLAEKVVLVVIDEAHKALGKHAYCEVIRGLQQSSQSSFRVLALTATPGAEVKTVQTVVENLMISKIEIRTEDSMDIKQYTHERVLDVIVVQMSDDIKAIVEIFRKVVGPNLERLFSVKAIYEKDPMKVSRYMLISARDKFRQTTRDGSVPAHRLHQAEADFGVCMALCDALQHLIQHGIRYFLHSLEAYIHDCEAMGAKLSNTRAAILKNPDFRGMMQNLRQMQARPGFLSHPKFQKLVECVVGHFVDHEESCKNNPDMARSTRIMIFSTFRESVLEIVNALSEHQPLVRVMSFVGQSSGKNASNGKGFTQKEQLEVISKFQSGDYNVLVSTCIGEEGLDIGEVDMIVCFDAQNSPIRMLQRMGRTGRKRQGKVVLLLSEGKEEDAHRRSQAQYKTVQKAIVEGQGKKIEMHPPHRMLPPGISPVCNKVDLEIPKYDLGKKTVGGRQSNASKNRKNAGSADSIPPNGSLTVAEAAEYERSFLIPSKRKLGPYPSLSSNLHWHSMVQPTKFVQRSSRCKDFVESIQLMETLGLQEEDGEPDMYGAEMQRYLEFEDMNYKSEFFASAKPRKRPKTTTTITSKTAAIELESPVAEERVSRRRATIVGLDDDTPTALELIQEEDNLPEAVDLLTRSFKKPYCPLRDPDRSKQLPISASPTKESPLTDHPPEDVIVLDDAADEFEPPQNDGVAMDHDYDYRCDDIYMSDHEPPYPHDEKPPSPESSSDPSFEDNTSTNYPVAPPPFSAPQQAEPVKLPKSPIFLVPETPERFRNADCKSQSLGKECLTLDTPSVLKQPSALRVAAASINSKSPLDSVVPETPLRKESNSDVPSVQFGDPLCRYKGASVIPLNLSRWPAFTQPMKETTLVFEKPPTTPFSPVEAQKMESNLHFDENVIRNEASKCQAEIPPTFASTTSPTCGTRRRAPILSHDDEDDLGIDKTPAKLADSLQNPKAILAPDDSLQNMFDNSDDEHQSSADEGDDYFSGGDPSPHAQTPAALRMVRARLQKKPRKPPVLRGSPILNSKTPQRPLRKRKGKKKRNYQEPNPYHDVEAELSEEADDSGDESIDGDIDVDLEGFVVADSEVSYSESAPNTVERRTDANGSPGISMYHRSLLSQHEGPQLGTRIIDNMLQKYHYLEKSRKTRSRDEWEGPATQFGEGAEAYEVYDDEDLADFVVDDDDDFEQTRPTKRKSKPRQKEVEIDTISAAEKSLAAIAEVKASAPTKVDVSAESKPGSFASDLTSKPCHVEKVYQVVNDQICIVADDREIRCGVSGILKSKYKVRVEFRHLVAGDYVISQRVAVERKSRSGNLKKMYQCPILLIELEKDNGEKDSQAQRNQFEGILASLIRQKVKILYSESREDTARLLFEIAKNETEEGLRLDVPTATANKNFGASPFLMTIPGISDATCLQLVHAGAFGSLRELLNADEAELLRRIPSMNKHRAKQIADYTQREFNEKASMIPE